jgi:RHS repeat-associated protein
VRTVVQAYVGGQWTAFSSTERDFIGRLPLGIETTFADGSSKSWRFLRGPDASGTLEGAGGARGVLAVLKDASSWKAVAADTLGNVLALAGTNGDFTRRTFDPWGNPLVRDASGSLRASTLTERRADYDALPLAWASQEYDPDTGLTHYHFREYSPSLGGWLTTDPIGLAGGYLNLRSYLGNRPGDGSDRWGLYWDDSMPMPEPQDPFSRGFSDAYRQRMSADSPVDDWRYQAGQAAGILGATMDSPEVQKQVKKNLKGLGTGVKRAITDIPDEVADIANGIASAASKAVDPDTYIEMADAIAMLYRCRQNPCCWKKLMESLGEMPSATLEAAARKLKDLGNLKQEEVFEMLGKEWGRAAMAVGAAKIAEGASAAESSMRDPKSLVSRQGPSEMTRNKIEKLAKDMKQNGFNPAHPIEVANINGEQVIIDGHHRAAAAIRAGIKEIPVTTTPVSPQRAAELAADAAAAAAERSLR